VDWCRTCGNDTPEGEAECDVCKQWWKDNEPMPLTSDAIRQLSDAEVLDLIIEEAAELIHAASKAKRFGSNGRHPKGGPPNNMALIAEAVQLNDLCRNYCARQGENWGEWSDRIATAAKAQAN
jgi:hypothetical protein